MREEIVRYNKQRKIKDSVMMSSENVYYFYSTKETADFIKNHRQNDLRAICISTNQSVENKNVYIVGFAFDYRHEDLFSMGKKEALIKPDVKYNDIATIYTMPLYEYEDVVKKFGGLEEEVIKKQDYIVALSKVNNTARMMLLLYLR